MGKQNQTSTPKKEIKRKTAPAHSPEAREQQMISLAVDLAEEQLRNKTASSQIITHYLKLATSREELEKEKLKNEVELTRAKTESLKQQAKMEETYQRAIAAMRSYQGIATEEDVFNEED